MARFFPRPYQSLIHDFILDHERGNVWASPGTGKTSSSIFAFDTLRTVGLAERALVLAPRRVALLSWPDEMVKWRESFGHLRMAAAIGTPEQRLAALRSMPDILTINYDNIDWLLDALGDEWPFDTVFADESTRLKGLRISLQRRKHKDGSFGEWFLQGQGAKRARSIGHLAHKKIKRWYNLTGSPAPNGLQDQWGQQWFIDAGQRLGNSFTSFSHRWFRTIPGRDARHGDIEPMPGSQREIEALLRETSITIDARDWFDIKEPIERHIEIELPARARKQYGEMQRELFTFVNDHPLEAVAAGAKARKLLQMASGSVWIDRDAKHWEKVHDEKIEALQSLVTEVNGEPMLVAYQFVPDKERILKAFPKFKTLDDRGAYEDFKRGRLPGLLVHPASAGHGLSMAENCRVMCDYSSDFNLELDEQVIERIGPTRQAQLGKDVPVYRYRLIAKDTIEKTAVLPALKYKMGVQEALKAAMKVS